jgi:hypothetical protein
VTATPIEIDGQLSLKQVYFLAHPWENLVDACVSLSAFEALAPGSEDVEVKLKGGGLYPPTPSRSGDEFNFKETGGSGNGLCCGDGCT